MGGGETMCIYFTAIGHLKAIDSKISLHLPNTEHLFLSKFCYWTKFFVFLPPMILCILRGCAKKLTSSIFVADISEDPTQPSEPNSGQVVQACWKTAGRSPGRRK